MAARIIDGRGIANEVRAALAVEVSALKQKGVRPGLGVILVGDDPASESYVRGKERACEKIGIYSDNRKMSADICDEDLLKVIEQMNADDRIHGILVQLPLPAHINESEMIEAVSPCKDVDGFHPFNVGRMVAGGEGFLPCTPQGIVELLVRSGVRIEGSQVVIVGRSNIVGKPLANMLIQKTARGNATVTVCHTRTRDLASHTRRADILVAAAGRCNTITADMVKEGVVVIDVGVNRIEDSTKKKGYRLAGDVDFDGVKEKASLITPVPGGVGPMTITMLLYNTVSSAKKAAGLQ